MPIEITKSFKASNGTIHATLADAQREEVGILFVGNPNADHITNGIFANRDAIVAILGTKTRKPRAPKVATTAPAKTGKKATAAV